MLLRAGAVAGLVSLLCPAASNAADWREGRTAFRLGVVERGTNGAVVDWSVVQTYLTGKLGLPVEVVLEADYAKLVDAQASARIDAAGLFRAPPSSRPNRFCSCVRAVAAPRAGDGAVGVRSVLIGRKGKVLLGDRGGKGPIRHRFRLTA